MNQKRTRWIDVAKGIVIILVVLGHTSIPKYIEQYIFSFHMPLSFFLSGYLFNHKKYKGYCEFIRKKACSLLIPYFIFSVITYLFWLFIGRKFGTDTDLNISLIKPLVGIIYSNGNDNWMIYNTPFWFLTCLFIVEIVFYLIIRNIKINHVLIAILIASSILGYLDSLYMPIRLPWSIDVSFTAIVFYGMGYISKNIIPKILSITLRMKILNIIVLSIINISFCHLNGRIDMNSNLYNNYLYFYLSSIAGIMVWLFIAHMLQNAKCISFIGQSSLIILALHCTIAISFIKAVISFGFKVPLESTNDSLVWGLVYTCGAIILLIPAIYIINNYFLWILGQRKIYSTERQENLILS